MWSSSTPSPYEIAGVAYKGAENLSKSLIILMEYGKHTLMIQIGEIRNKIMARIVQNVSEIQIYSNPVLCFVEKRFPQATKEFRIIIRHHANILHFISSNIDEHRS